VDESQLDTALRTALGGSAVTVSSVLNIPAVSGSVGFIAGTVASLPIRLYRTENGQSEEVTDDYRLRLLNEETGDLLDAFQWKCTLVRDYLLPGNGYTYVDGEWIAEIFSLTCTYAQTENGNTVLRLSDAEAVRTMEELMALYREETPQTVPLPERDPEPDMTGSDSIRRVYIVTGDNYENPEFTPAEAVVKNSGLVCTMFLHGRSDPEKFWEYAFPGDAGICAGSVEEADAVNDTLESLFCRRLEYVLPAHGDTDRAALRQAGYIVVEPDFVVDYSTDPDAVYAELTAFLEENDSVIVKVSGDGCSQRMIALLCNLMADPEACRTEMLLP